MVLEVHSTDLAFFQEAKNPEAPASPGRSSDRVLLLAHKVFLHLLQEVCKAALHSTHACLPKDEAAGWRFHRRVAALLYAVCALARACHKYKA